LKSTTPTLADLARQNVFVEMGTRTAFFALLHAAGQEHRWTLIAEHEKKVGGKTIRPDGTFKDEMNLVRGYWEGRDTSLITVSFKSHLSSVRRHWKSETTVAWWIISPCSATMRGQLS